MSRWMVAATRETVWNRIRLTGQLVRPPPFHGKYRPSPFGSVSGNLRLVTTYAAVDPWAALADGTRRTIFKRLAAGPMSVGELADGLPVSRPAVSQHLKVLRCAGLVADRRMGTRRLYQVNPSGVAALRAELDMFWDKALTAFQEIADQEGAD